MKKILNIQSSPRGKASFSIQLADAVVAKLVAAHPCSVVETIDLGKTAFPHLEEAHLTSFFTPVDKRTVVDRVAIRHSDESIHAVKDAALDKAIASIRID